MISKTPIHERGWEGGGASFERSPPLKSAFRYVWSQLCCKRKVRIACRGPACVCGLLAIDAWVASAGIEADPVFRCVSRTGKVWGDGISEKVVWWVVREYAKLAGIDVLAPHDLRRTCARLCQSAGGELEQIQFLLGHRSVETTERYLGSRQRLVQPVNDRIGIEPGSSA
jgi:site-specific recombinase XerC